MSSDTSDLPSVTLTSPLVIDDQFVPLNYDKITIQPGGQIIIKIPCIFSCNSLIKSTGTENLPVPYPGYDIVVVGKDGDDGGNGSDGSNGSNRLVRKFTTQSQ